MMPQQQETRQCAFTGCSHTFIGPPQQKYCLDPTCIEARKILAQKNRKPKLDTDANNLTITKGKFPHGTILSIQCAAHGVSGRCSNKFTVSYTPSRTVYPKYCPFHRNAYQRARFEGKVIIDANSAPK